MTVIITPEERFAEPRGARILIVGPYGVGKTTLAGKLDPTETLFIDIENGALAIDAVPMPHVRPQTWPEIRDLIVRIAGPNRSFAPQEPYSQAHFDRVGGYLPDIERFRTVFFDTVTAAARLCFRWASRSRRHSPSAASPICAARTDCTRARCCSRCIICKARAASTSS